MCCALGPISVGSIRTLCLESLHTGPLNPCYATVSLPGAVLWWSSSSVAMWHWHPLECLLGDAVIAPIYAWRCCHRTYLESLCPSQVISLETIVIVCIIFILYCRTAVSCMCVQNAVRKHSALLRSELDKLKTKMNVQSYTDLLSPTQSCKLKCEHYNLAFIYRKRF